MAQEFRQGGYKSLGEALDHYLNPEESNSNTVRRFLGNLYGNAREMVGMDEESIIKNLEDRQAALELSKHELGQEEYTGNLDSLQDRAKDFYINLGSNVGAVSPVKQSVKSIISPQERASNLAKFMEGSKVKEPVYHGSTSYFNEFSKDKLGSKTDAKSASGGFFFSNNPKTADAYSVISATDIIPSKYKTGNIGGIANTYSKKTPIEYIEKQNIYLDEFNKNLKEISSKFEDPIFKNKYGDAFLDKEKASKNISLIDYDLAKKLDNGYSLESIAKELGINLGITSDINAYRAIEKELQRKYANSMAGNSIGSNPQIYKTYINLKKPLIIDLEGSSFDELASKKINSSILKAKKNGYDGLIVKNIFDGGPTSDHYIVFDPNQIKSATGNRGTFDSNDPNILHGVSLSGFGEKKEEKKESRLKSFGSKR